MPAVPRLATLPRLSESGKPASVRFILPPNLESAAARDAIAVRIEIDIQGRGKVPASMVPDALPLHVPATQLGAVFLVESWNGGRPAAFAQLSREQLAALLAVARGEPIFFYANRPKEPIAWSGDTLPGVSEHLAAPAPADAPSAPAPAASRATRQPPRSRHQSADTAPARTTARRRADPDATPATVDGSEHFIAIQLPSREHPTYGAVLETLKAEGFRLETSNRRWWLRDRHRTLQFLARYWDIMEREWQARFTDNFRRNTAGIARAEVACSIHESGDTFEVQLGVRAGDAPAREINDALTTGRPFIEADGRLYLLDAGRLERLHRAQKALGGSTALPLLGRSAVRIPRARVAEADALLDELSPNFQAPETWRRRAAVARHRDQLPAAPIAPDLEKTLRGYQKLGAAWLWHLSREGLGGILADEMGLGKTLQALALITAIRRENPGAAPALVVCPASLLENWRREARRFTPQLRVRVHHGSGRDRDAGAFGGCDLVITSYGVLARDREIFEGLSWSLLLADEAQHVKNRRTQNARALQAVRADARILLTGTPVENSLDDLQALFAVILPGYMQPIPPESRGDERQWHEERIRRQAAPYILRRRKADVAAELPPKIEQTVFVELTPEQRALYEAIRASSEQNLQKLQLAGRPEGQVRMAMFTELLRLRQVCCDPRLVERTRRAEESAKLAAFLELLDEAVDDGHRLLVFSQFTSLLALVREALREREIEHCVLDGSMSARERQAQVDRFNDSPDIPVFLLSLKAGGTGLNLASADTVVHLDPWWNPAVEAQATDRAHRIGQTRVVTSYKLIAADTVEERVLMMQREKRRLLEDVFEAADAANARLSLEDLRSLIA